jgi:lysophospholipase L1-like esterase
MLWNDLRGHPPTIIPNHSTCQSDLISVHSHSPYQAIRNMNAKNLILAGVLMSLVHSAEPMSPVDPSTYKAPVRVACIGDSITQGSGAAKGKSYPAQLQNLLGNAWLVGNFGVSGRTLLKKGDFPYWKEKAYQNSLGFSPDVVIIMLGTNDTKPQNWKHEAEFTADYRELVKSFQALESKPRVYVCRPCPIPEPGNFGINETCAKEEIKRIDALAAEMKLGMIDMHAALAEKPQLLPDRVHPNTEGAGEMAKAAFAVLTGKPAPETAP